MPGRVFWAAEFQRLNEVEKKLVVRVQKILTKDPPRTFGGSIDGVHDVEAVSVEKRRNGK